METVEPLTADELTAFRKTHAPRGNVAAGLAHCAAGDSWPCKQARALATIAALEAENARLREDAEAWERTYKVAEQARLKLAQRCAHHCHDHRCPHTCDAVEREINQT